MICPRCKKHIPNNTINCPHCNMKVGTTCKHCGAYNLIYNKSCVECGTELVKFCPECKSANFPNANRCRKCGHNFKKNSQFDDNYSNNKIIPPRQFVLPDISRYAPRRRVVIDNQAIPTVRNLYKNGIIDVNPQYIIQEGDPIMPSGGILESDNPIISKRTSSKKMSGASKLKKVPGKKRVRKKAKPDNNDDLQDQLNTLQNQLAGLQEKLNLIPTENQDEQNLAQPIIEIKEAVENDTPTDENNQIIDIQTINQELSSLPNQLDAAREKEAAEHAKEEAAVSSEIEKLKRELEDLKLQNKALNLIKQDLEQKNLQITASELMNISDETENLDQEEEFNILPKLPETMASSEKIEDTPSVSLDSEPKIETKALKPKQKIRKSRKHENQKTNITNEKTSVPQLKMTQKLKGILPLKLNILPNRRNTISKKERRPFPLKNRIPEPSLKPFKTKENIPEAQTQTTPSEGLEPLEYSPNLFTQQSAKNILVNTLLNTSVKIISLSGASGIGKNVVLKSAIDALKENQFVWLIGKATPLSQITPCGLFQDILLTFFNVPNFCVNTIKLKKDSLKFFKTEFPSLKIDEIDDLINFLYPEKLAYYEEILKNKARTFSILRKVFDVISSRMQSIFVIDNFEHIDKMSYEFLKTLISEKTGLENTKFILTFNEPRSAKAYLYDKSLTDASYCDISLTPFNTVQTSSFINQYNPLFVGVSQSLKDAIHNQTGGNPAYIEQILNLATDSSRNYLPFNMPETFEQVIKQRLEILKQENSAVFDLLVGAAILGFKFYPVILNQLFKIDDKAFVELFSSLLDLNYIIPVNESAYEFKSTKLWKSVLNIARKDRSFKTINEKLFTILSGITLSSHSSLALIATNLNQNISALNAWSDVVRQTSAIGDENIYIMAQKYSLLLVEKLQGKNCSLIKNNIFERLGKLMSFNNPKGAIEYLPRVIEHARRLEDNLKEFELTSYLAQCCHKVGNHHGVIECVDNTVANIDPTYDLEIAMIKSRKLESLLILGNVGELVDLIDQEILPVFERNLTTSKSHKNIKIEDLYEAWLETYLILANALVLQGDNRAVGVVSTIFEIIEKNNIKNELYICKVKLTLALSNTLKGDIQQSETILDETLAQYKNNDIMDAQAITTWNIISVLNSLARNELEGLQDELFQIVSFANNNNDVFSKNILKLLLGKVLKEKGKFKQALSIYSEQVSYFAKEKNALGVLMSWYFISEVTLLTAGAKKSLEYALKALDIAQSQRIQNFYFITKFDKIIGEAYLAIQDYDSAKAYIESAIGVARQFDLQDALSELYYLYGKYLQDLSSFKSESQRDYAVSSFKMYDKAINLAKSLKNNHLASTIMASAVDLRRFCQKNGIILR